VMKTLFLQEIIPFLTFYTQRNELESAAAQMDRKFMLRT